MIYDSVRNFFVHLLQFDVFVQKTFAVLAYSFADTIESKFCFFFVKAAGGSFIKEVEESESFLFGGVFGLDVEDSEKIG